MKGHRVAIATLGCKVNQFDSFDMVRQFQESHWEVVEFNQSADIFIINSCTVTSRSDAETRRLARRAKRNNPSARVVVTGCYAQVSPDRLSGLAEIDQVLGNEEKNDIVGNLLHGNNKVTVLDTLPPETPINLTTLTDHTRAFLNIQNGCEQGCSYCIVPQARGPYRSVTSKDAINAVQDLENAGYKEIVLTGIHLGAYRDPSIDGYSLPDLLKDLALKTRIPRIRLGSIEPN